VKVGLAELRVRPLAIDRTPQDLLNCLVAASDLDTDTLICLAGRWAGTGIVIAWDPVRTATGHNRDLLTEQPTVSATLPQALGGGWFGWLPFDDRPAWWGFFQTLLRQDASGRWWLETIATNEDLDCTAERVERAATTIAPPPAAIITELSGTPRDTHLAAIEHAISAIRAGDLFQVNVCARFTGRLTGSALDLFRAGLTQLHPDYSAYLQTPQATVVSLSPELFLRRQGRQLLSAPIKGTRKRSVDGDRLDDPAARELRDSAKDSAENVMIVDLMRNDLSRVCEPGTVTTSTLLAVRPAPGVWHLVSEVAGQMRPEATDADLIQATFPPGSVTGAPKIRALELIRELEPAPRGVFTGAIGYASPLDRAEFNVAIRTFEVGAASEGNDALVELGVGGGITADSVPMTEWQECLIKAAPLLSLGGVALPVNGTPWPECVDPAEGIFEAMLAIDGRVIGLSDHLTRLDSSCREVYGQKLPDDLAYEIADAITDNRGRKRLRLTVLPDQSRPHLEIVAVGDAPIELGLISYHGRRGCWRHKWADRRWLGGVELTLSEPGASHAGSALPLFVSRDCAWETSRSNIAIVSQAGVVATPPLTDDVLPGVTRRRFLDAAGDRGWRIEIRPVSLADLASARLVVSLSSIRGVSAVSGLDGNRLSVDHAILDDVRGWLTEFRA
jgi:para-aminobenzoate synthetase/4-amino-4-deoxychorismate lyase